MNISIFDALGPLMIGPSSSHTAGAAKLSRMAKMIAADPFTHVSFGLHGSFAKTCRGHGTDIALVAGALGIAEDDENLRNAFFIAKERGLTYDFFDTELDDVHENSVVMRFTHSGGQVSEIVGSSVGGGEIFIKRINGFNVGLSLHANTMIICHNDKVGVISDVTKVLADHGINIGVMTLNRENKGAVAYCTIEADDFISQEVADAVRSVRNVIRVQAVNPQ